MEKDPLLEKNTKELNNSDQVRISQLKTIVDTLLSIEFCVPWIGIPYLPNNNFRKKISKDFFFPEKDYLKASLVTVKSSLIVEFNEILKSKNIENHTEYDFVIIKLRNLSLVDKIYFPLISFVIVFLISYLTLIPFSMELERRVLACLMSGIGSGITASLFYIEEIRFFFFTKLLDNEILRRSGKFPDSKIPEINLKAYSRVKY